MSRDWESRDWESRDWLSWDWVSRDWESKTAGGARTIFGGRYETAAVRLATPAGFQASCRGSGSVAGVAPGGAERRRTMAVQQSPSSPLPSAVAAGSRCLSNTGPCLSNTAPPTAPRVHAQHLVNWGFAAGFQCPRADPRADRCPTSRCLSNTAARERIAARPVAACPTPPVQHRPMPRARSASQRGTAPDRSPRRCRGGGGVVVMAGPVASPAFSGGGGGRCPRGRACRSRRGRSRG